MDNSPDCATAEQSVVRPQVLTSWARSLLYGLDPKVMTIPVAPLSDRRGRLHVAADRVAERLATELDATGVWCLFLDREARLVREPAGDRASVDRAKDRGALRGAVFEEQRVGTNGPGTALERGSTFVVVGPEHFHDAVQELISVGVPVRDPVTHRMVGILGFLCRQERANRLLLPYASAVGEALQDELLGMRPRHERALLDEFVRVGHVSRRPVVGFAAGLSLYQDEARAVLAGLDEEALRYAALDAVRDGRAHHLTIARDDGSSMHVMCHPVSAAADAAAAVVVEIDPAFTRSNRTPRSTRRVRGAAERLREEIANARRCRVPVVVRGEPGTGKTTVTMAGNDGFVLFDSRDAAHDPGWVGTVDRAARDGDRPLLIAHLDETPARHASALLSTLRARSVPVCATAGVGEPSHTAVRRLLGFFPVIIDIAPLRERVGEIPALVEEILAESAPRGLRCSPEVLAALTASTWPDNVRSLRTALATAALRTRTGVIEIDDLPHEVVEADPRRRLPRIEQIERGAILQAIHEASGDKARAAEILGISRATIYRRLKYFGIRTTESPTA